MGYAVLRVRALMLQGVPIQPKGFGLWAFGARLAEGFRHAGMPTCTQSFEVQMRLGNVPGAFPHFEAHALGLGSRGLDARTRHSENVAKCCMLAVRAHK